MATKAKVQQVRTITVEQGARFLAITNMALENQLSRSRGFTFTHRGWSPIGGLEIDDGFGSLRDLLDEHVWSGLHRETEYFRRQLRQNSSAYSVTAFGPLSLVVE